VAEELDTGGNETVQFTLHGTGLDKKDFLGKSDPFLNIYRVNADGRYRVSIGMSESMIIFSRDLAYRSEVIKKTLDPRWKPFEIHMRQLCGGERNQ
jgi:hypothetical protein